MAVCERVRSIIRYDAYSRERKCVHFGCGKCPSCLKNLQDAWCIRVQETAKAFDGFIYDTLTFSPASLPLLDRNDILCDPDYIITPAVDMLLKRYDGFVPYFPRDIVSKWIHRGRNAYYSVYKKRLKLKYLICMEYGPKWSRPHAHLVMFGIEAKDYYRFFARPWKDTFGFSYYKYIERSVNTRKDIECISRYISKYISKGVFESPLVKCGLAPKPWRLASHGIGKEYIENKRFDIARTSEAKYLQSISPIKKIHNVWDGQHYVYKVHSSVPTVIHKPLDKCFIETFSLYRDAKGFPHALPRYYKDVILGRQPNLLKYEVQNLISKDAEQRRNSEISRIAASFVSRQSRDLCSQADQISLPASAVVLATYIYLAQQQNKAHLECERNQIKLKNHYFRPLRVNSKRIILNQ